MTLHGPISFRSDPDYDIARENELAGNSATQIFPFADMASLSCSHPQSHHFRLFQYAVSVKRNVFFTFSLATPRTAKFLAGAFHHGVH